MTKSLFASFLTIGAVTILAATSMFAQTSLRLNVNVPFEFSAGENSLPAGEYDVRLSYTPSSIWIRNADGKHNLTVLAHNAKSMLPADSARLTFHVYGDRYYLSQVFISGGSPGAELPRSLGEQEEIAARHASKTVTVVASLR